MDWVVKPVFLTSRPFYILLTQRSFSDLCTVNNFCFVLVSELLLTLIDKAIQVYVNRISEKI